MCAFDLLQPSPEVASLGGGGGGGSGLDWILANLSSRYFLVGGSYSYPKSFPNPCSYHRSTRSWAISIPASAIWFPDRVDILCDVLASSYACSFLDTPPTGRSTQRPFPLLSTKIPGHLHGNYNSTTNEYLWCRCAYRYYNKFCGDGIHFFYKDIDEIILCQKLWQSRLWSPSFVHDWYYHVIPTTGLSEMTAAPISVASVFTSGSSTACAILAKSEKSLNCLVYNGA